MPRYGNIDTDALRQAATQLLNKAADMRAAVASVDAAMSPARGMNAPVIVKEIQQWDALKTKLQQSFAESETGSKLINTTSINIDTVLGGGGTGG